MGWRDPASPAAAWSTYVPSRLFFDAHRALIDSLAGVTILASKENGTGSTTMALLRENALRNSVLLGPRTPVHSKDLLMSVATLEPGGACLVDRDPRGATRGRA